MIRFFSGTPGSGKSLHVAEIVYGRLKLAKKPVITSFDVNTDLISKGGKRRIGKFLYKDLNEMTPAFFYEYARENHVFGKENQTLVVMDECQILFNPREFSRADRLDWIKFFTQHRKLGYDFILISQFDMLVDKQIRNLFEYDIKHRKINNYGFGKFFPVQTFVAVTYWYGVRTKIDSEFFIYRRKYGRIYNTAAMWGMPELPPEAARTDGGEDAPRKDSAPDPVADGNPTNQQAVISA